MIINKKAKRKELLKKIQFWKRIYNEFWRYKGFK
jgi:hypothetical protein